MIYKIDIPIRLIISTKDDLIPRQDLINFANLTNCECEYINDEHIIKKEESWEKIFKIIKELK